MKKEEWNEGLNNIDSDLVEKYVEEKDKLTAKKKRKAVLVRIVSAAACLALILSAIIVVPMLVTSPTSNIDYTPIIFDATKSPEKLTGSGLQYIVGGTSGSGGSGLPPYVRLDLSDFIVKAKVVKNYPDLYYILDTNSEYPSNEYRLIKMECLEVISGERVPEYFYYLIPNYDFVDMSVYDFLIIAMEQYAVGDYILKNKYKNQLEVLDLPIFADCSMHPDLGNVIAFSNGIFDESLWQSPNWKYGYQFAQHMLDNPERNTLVVNRGDSESEVVEEIERRVEEYLEWEWSKIPVFVDTDSLSPETKAVMEYVKPFENGVFAQTYYENQCIIFVRFINGCQTEERIVVDVNTEKVDYYGVKYTKEDMTSMENLSAHLSNIASKYEKELPIPPHTDIEGKELISLHLYAWYAKVDGKLYGVIKTVWRHREKDDWDIQYDDEEYILYNMSERTANKMSREELIKIVGERNISDRPLGEAYERIIN